MANMNKHTVATNASGRKVKVVIKSKKPTLMQGTGTAITVRRQKQQKKDMGRFSPGGAGIRG